MAIYHLSEQTISRTKGRNIIAMAAYRAADKLVEKIRDEDSGIEVEQTHDYRHKRNVVYRQIMGPEDAPEWMLKRELLWQGVKDRETKKNAAYAQEMVVAIPIELNQEQAIGLVEEFVKRTLVQQGMIVDVAIHWEEGNPHAHIMQTMRVIEGENFGQKSRTWHRRKGLYYKRESWAYIANKHLRQHGFEAQIDHRSYTERGIDLIPTVHEGVAATQIELRGEVSYVRQMNRKRRLENVQKIEVKPSIVIEKLAQQHVTFTKREITKEVKRFAHGDEKVFTLLFDQVCQHPLLIRLAELDMNGQERFVYAPYYEKERQLLQIIETMRQQHLQASDQRIERLLDKAQHLSQEQADAVRYLCDQHQSLSILHGKAGTGKSTIMEMVTNYYTQSGYQVKGAALAAIAAVGLAEKGGMDARTLASWQASWKIGKDLLQDRDVLIVDEAGMIDTDMMYQVVERVKQAGAKLILVGDVDQLQPIGMGRALHGMIDRVGAIEISKVYRQEQTWMQQATQDMAAGKMDDGMMAYYRKGHLSWQANKKEVLAQMVRDYLFDREQERLMGVTKTSILMAYRRRDVSMLNRQIRQALKVQGLLRGGQKIIAMEGLLELAPGDRILCCKNNRQFGLNNGMTGSVIAIDESHVWLRLDQGEREVMLPFEQYPYLMHGYAATIHKEQGITVDRSYLMIDELHDRHSVYVGMSRHREDIRIYVDQHTHPDVMSLSRQLHRYSKQHMAHDFELKPEQQEARQRVQDYKALCDRIIQHKQEIEAWSKAEEKSFFEHPEAALFKAQLSKRKELAKQINQATAEHQAFMKQARVSLPLLKRHAGDLLITNLRAHEYEQYQEVIRYQYMVRRQEFTMERFRLAYTIDQRSKRHKALYTLFQKETGLDRQVVQHDCLVYQEQLQHVSLEPNLHLDDQFALLHQQRMPESYDGEIYVQGMIKQVQQLQNDHQQVAQSLAPYQQRIEKHQQHLRYYEDHIENKVRLFDRILNQEQRDILDGLLARHTLEGTLERITQGSLGKPLKASQKKQLVTALRRYDQLLQLKLRAELTLQQLQQDVDYRGLDERQQQLKHQLGRFMTMTGQDELKQMQTRLRRTVKKQLSAANIITAAHLPAWQAYDQLVTTLKQFKQNQHMLVRNRRQQHQLQQQHQEITHHIEADIAVLKRYSQEWFGKDASSFIALLEKRDARLLDQVKRLLNDRMRQRHTPFEMTFKRHKRQLQEDRQRIYMHHMTQLRQQLEKRHVLTLSMEEIKASIGYIFKQLHVQRQLQSKTQLKAQFIKAKRHIIRLYRHVNPQQEVRLQRLLEHDQERQHQIERLVHQRQTVKLEKTKAVTLTL